jgi:hypothetical protein
MKLDDDMPLDQQVTKSGKSQHTPMMHGCVLPWARAVARENYAKTYAG